MYLHIIKKISFSSNNTIILLLLFLLGNSTACEKDYTSAHKKLLLETPFNSFVIDNIILYDSLRTELLSNSDFIFASTKEEVSIFVHKNGFSYDRAKMEHLPDRLKSVEDLIHLIGYDNLKAIYIKNNQSISFKINQTDISQYSCDIRENLYSIKGNRKRKNDWNMKDTIINDTWQYQIWIDKDYGW